MESATATWTGFRQRSLNAAISILALSLSGWAQQAPSSSQKHQGAKTHSGTVEYKDTKYGFRITLPESWKGYQVLWSEWDGGVLATDGTVNHVLRGPQLKIRHPKWTQENPREDMPIMIYTIVQWKESPIVSAAPFDPGEIGRNGKYIFAIPPRWNYDFAEGWEEASKILNANSFHTFAPAN
jgi:hypothetical protein